MMKTSGSALFLLLIGVLTAGAKTSVDDNLQGEIEDAGFNDEELDSLKSQIEERALTGDLDDDEADLNDDDLDSLRSALTERALAGNLDDEGSDLDSLKSAMEERGLTGDLDDDDADMDSLRAAMEERGLARERENSPIEDRAVSADLDAEDADLEKSTIADIDERAVAGDATGAQPVDVARRGLRCRRGICYVCINWRIFRGCIVARWSRRGINLYITINRRIRWRRFINIRVRKSYTIRWGRLYIYITNVNPRTRSFCYQLKYKLGRFWGKTHYLKYPRRRRCIRIR